MRMAELQTPDKTCDRNEHNPLEEQNITKFSNGVTPDNEEEVTKQASILPAGLEVNCGFSLPTTQSNPEIADIQNKNLTFGKTLVVDHGEEKEPLKPTSTEVAMSTTSEISSSGNTKEYMRGNNEETFSSPAMNKCILGKSGQGHSVVDKMDESHNLMNCTNTKQVINEHHQTNKILIKDHPDAPYNSNSTTSKDTISKMPSNVETDTLDSNTRGNSCTATAPAVISQNTDFHKLTMCGSLMNGRSTTFDSSNVNKGSQQKTWMKQAITKPVPHIDEKSRDKHCKNRGIPLSPPLGHEVTNAYNKLVLSKEDSPKNVTVAARKLLSENSEPRVPEYFQKSLKKEKQADSSVLKNDIRGQWKTIINVDYLKKAVKPTITPCANYIKEVTLHSSDLDMVASSVVTINKDGTHCKARKSLPGKTNQKVMNKSSTPPKKANHIPVINNQHNITVVKLSQSCAASAQKTCANSIKKKNGMDHIKVIQTARKSLPNSIKKTSIHKAVDNVPVKSVPVPKNVSTIGTNQIVDNDTAQNVSPLIPRSNKGDENEADSIVRSVQKSLLNPRTTTAHKTGPKSTEWKTLLKKNVTQNQKVEKNAPSKIHQTAGGTLKAMAETAASNSGVVFTSTPSAISTTTMLTMPASNLQFPCKSSPSGPSQCGVSDATSQRKLTKVTNNTSGTYLMSQGLGSQYNNSLLVNNVPIFTGNEVTNSVSSSGYHNNMASKNIVSQSVNKGLITSYIFLPLQPQVSSPKKLLSPNTVSSNFHVVKNGFQPVPKKGASININVVKPKGTVKSVASSLKKLSSRNASIRRGKRKRKAPRRFSSQSNDEDRQPIYRKRFAERRRAAKDKNAAKKFGSSSKVNALPRRKLIKKSAIVLKLNTSNTKQPISVLTENTNDNIFLQNNNSSIKCIKSSKANILLPTDLVKDKTVNELLGIVDQSNVPNQYGDRPLGFMLPNTSDQTSLNGTAFLSDQVLSNVAPSLVTSNSGSHINMLPQPIGTLSNVTLPLTMLLTSQLAVTDLVGTTTEPIVKSSADSPVAIVKTKTTKMSSLPTNPSVTTSVLPIATGSVRSPCKSTSYGVTRLDEHVLTAISHSPETIIDLKQDDPIEKLQDTATEHHLVGFDEKHQEASAKQITDVLKNADINKQPNDMCTQNRNDVDVVYLGDVKLVKGRPPDSEQENVILQENDVAEGVLENVGSQNNVLEDMIDNDDDVLLIEEFQCEALDIMSLCKPKRKRRLNSQTRTKWLRKLKKQKKLKSEVMESDRSENSEVCGELWSSLASCSRSNSVSTLGSLASDDYTCGSIPITGMGNEYRNSELRRDPPLCCCKMEKDPNILNSVICQAIEYVDGGLVLCEKTVQTSFLIRPSSRISSKAFCTSHRKKALAHGCCPGCGCFCTMGTFMECRREHIRHHFHRECIEEINQILYCPHCGEDASRAHKVTNVVPDDLDVITPSELHSNRRIKLPNALMETVEGISVVCMEEEHIESTKHKARIGGKSSVILMESRGDFKMDVHSMTLKNGRKLTSGDLPPGPRRKTLTTALKYLESFSSKKLGFSPKNLYLPSVHGDLQKVIALLVEGFDPNYRFPEHSHETAMHKAASNGHVEILCMLLQAGGNCDALDEDMQTPLMCAISSQQLECVKYLIMHGADASCKDDEGTAALHMAAKDGFLEGVEYLTSLPDLNINIQDDGGWTPLVWGAEAKRIRVVRLLLERGCDPNIRDKEGNTGLHWAAYAGADDIIKLFVEKKCDVNTTNHNGDTPLHIAAREDRYESTVMLLMRHANTLLQNRDNDLAQHCCNPSSDIYLALQVNNRLRQASALRTVRTERVLTKDISRGREARPIPVVNAVDDDDFPNDFLYVAHSCEKSSLNIDRRIIHMQGCQCEDDCSLEICFCARSSVNCWYTREGKLTSQFNYQDPPLIFECGRACSCWTSCKNRVVQHGIRCHLQLFRTNKMGWGLRALHKIPKGTFVCEYAGELISDAEADRRQDDSYLFDLDNREGDVYCIDARYYGNISRFINHLCEPNIVPVRIFVDHHDLRFPRIVFFTSRDVNAYEELGFDYGDKFWAIKSKYFNCCCGSPYCKHPLPSPDLEMEDAEDEIIID